MEGTGLPSEREVVDLYKSKNIKGMRLYYPRLQALNALRGSNIEVILGVEQNRLQELANNPSAATTWVQNNVRNFWPGVRFKYIGVGNEEIPGRNAQFILPAMRNVYNAIKAAGLQNQVKVSTAVATSVVVDSYPPSKGQFSPQARPIMEQILRFLADTGAPLLANVYPYFSYRDSRGSISLPYALFTAPQPIVQDLPYRYQNLFDAITDALYAAMEKTNAAGVPIVVSESGWPSAGNAAATIANARTYNQNLIRHARQGTPRRPGKGIETYVFAMFNENNKQPPGEERNFGLFYPNKQPVYPVTFP
ncbi:glucan endo-1,3-beta-glucosidase-like [Aristolochia californica]|uniref:glucan endo-1,3-beta-glucosidase-like n=1 Tax=Aristolochia californica TaxID=171875 RepID=UPI0035DBB50E